MDGSTGTIFNERGNNAGQISHPYEKSCFYVALCPEHGALRCCDDGDASASAVVAFPASTDRRENDSISGSEQKVPSGRLFLCPRAGFTQRGAQSATWMSYFPGAERVATPEMISRMPMNTRLSGFLTGWHGGCSSGKVKGQTPSSEVAFPSLLSFRHSVLHGRITNNTDFKICSLGSSDFRLPAYAAAQVF